MGDLVDAYLLEYASCVFELICRLQAHFSPTENHRKYQSADSGSNGPSVAQEPSEIQSTQAKTRRIKTRQARTAHQRKLGAVGASGRPADHLSRPTRPMGPTASTFPRGAPSLAPNVSSAEKSCDLGMAPSYKYKGRGRGMDTHITPSQLTFLP